MIFWNFIAMTALAFTPVEGKDGDSTSSGYTSTWIVALLLLLLLIPGTWYR